MSEVISIHTTTKGKDLLKGKTHVQSLSGVFFTFGTLVMVVLGALSYKEEQHFFRLSNIFFRLLILVITAFIICLLGYFTLPILGGSIPDGKIFFFNYCPYLFLFLCFFFSGGLFSRVLAKAIPLSLLIALLFWYASVEIVPDLSKKYLDENRDILFSNDVVNLKKTERLMDFEREVVQSIKGIKNLDERNKVLREKAQHFFKTGYVENTNIEIQINDRIGQILESYSQASSWYPSTFYELLCGEISGKGHSSYLGFVQYVLELRHAFVEFCLKKRYEAKDKDLEYFIKRNENVFKAKSNIPSSFLQGTLITLLYTIALFAASLLILRSRRKKKLETEEPDYEAEEGFLNIVVCEKNEDDEDDENNESDSYMEKLFNHYRQQPDTTCIDNVTGEDIDPGTPLRHTLAYFCKLLGARHELAVDHMKKLGVPNLKIKAKNKKHRAELVKKTYLAALLAQDKKTVVFKHFLKQESRTFQRQFLELIDREMEVERIFIYLMDEPFHSESPFSKEIPVDKYKLFKKDSPTKVRLR